MASERRRLSVVLVIVAVAALGYVAVFGLVADSETYAEQAEEIETGGPYYTWTHAMIFAAAAVGAVVVAPLLSYVTTADDGGDADAE